MWKNWPYWLRGGLIGAVVYLILGFALFFILQPVAYFSLNPLIYLAYPTIYVTNFIIQILMNPSGNAEGLELIAGSFLAVFFGAVAALLINGFIIGALIGWIIGRRKSKKQTP